jgi:hypothetical protein
MTMTMTSKMKTAAVVVAMTLASVMAGCSAEEAEPEAVASNEEALAVGAGGGASKTKGDLEADGYTCSSLAGTTVTLCWKNGSPGYTCNDRGTCIPNAKRSPGGIIAPVPTAVLAR